MIRVRGRIEGLEDGQYVFKAWGKHGEMHFLRHSQLCGLEPVGFPIKGTIEIPRAGLPVFQRRKNEER